MSTGHDDGTIAIHAGGRCVGVWRAGMLFTHNMTLTPHRARAFAPCAEGDVPDDLVAYLEAARTRAARLAVGPRTVGGGWRR